jgi:hypothetical protein
MGGRGGAFQGQQVRCIGVEIRVGTPEVACREAERVCAESECEGRVADGCPECSGLRSTRFCDEGAWCVVRAKRALPSERQPKGRKGCGFQGGCAGLSVCRSIRFVLGFQRGSPKTDGIRSGRLHSFLYTLCCIAASALHDPRWPGVQEGGLVVADASLRRDEPWTASGLISVEEEQCAA